MLAQKQVQTELNSSSDNPVIDSENRETYYCCNFQAASVTSAMEKTRTAVQMLGRIMFGQAYELIDPNLNNGLPASLAADNPSTSFTMKGLDISMAAYMSEVCFLASPVSNHVQTAEMHNQAINSLALLSARMTAKAIEMLQYMAASTLYVCSQATDLRVMQLLFFTQLDLELPRATKRAFLLAPPHFIHALNQEVHRTVTDTWKCKNREDIADRIRNMSGAALVALFQVAAQHAGDEYVGNILQGAQAWRHDIQQAVTRVYDSLSREFVADAPTITARYLGASSGALYRKIRLDLAVPFHQGIVEHPGSDFDLQGEERMSDKRKKTVGGWVSVIYQALVDGELYPVIYGADGLSSEINGGGETAQNGE